MPLGRYFAVAIEVVQQDELPGQAMGVGRDFFREDAQVRIAVAFLHVAEDLVVGAVFANDVDAILDRAGIADLGGMGLSLGTAPTTP